MVRVDDKTRLFRHCAVSIALIIVFESISAAFGCYSAQTQPASGTRTAAKRMADGKQWTTKNLNVKTEESYCYGDAESHCRRYGRLYTRQSASRVCQSLGDGWRLPTVEDWRLMAKKYGGASDDSNDRGKAAYRALMAGGGSGFNAQLGGGRSADGQYARLEAHGFYWTASASDPVNGWYYNFGKGGQALHQQSGGEKQEAFSVRCIRE